jgi:hypothetical protein
MNFKTHTHKALNHLLYLFFRGCFLHGYDHDFLAANAASAFFSRGKAARFGIIFPAISVLANG